MTIDNNLGPDRLAGPKALKFNYCRQPTLLYYVISYACFGPRHSTYSYC